MLLFKQVPDLKLGFLFIGLKSVVMINSFGIMLYERISKIEYID